MISMIGSDLSLPVVVKSMVRSDRKWKAVYIFCGAVVGAKETAAESTERRAERQAHVRHMRK